MPASTRDLTRVSIGVKLTVQIKLGPIYNRFSQSVRRILPAVQRRRTVARRLGQAQILSARYLDTIEVVLTGVIYEDPPLPAFGGKIPFDRNVREFGMDWPSQAMTMIGMRRLRNFRDLIELAIRHDIPGDIIETGVWRGGACILARAVLLANGVTERNVIVADSFEGLPPPDAQKYPSDIGSVFHEYADLSVSLETVKNNFRKFNLLDDQVVFLKGWFKDTMPRVPTDKLAIIRLDGDMYESTIVVLEHLYDRLSPGGWVIIDDYEIVPTCKSAVGDFFAKRKLAVKLEPIVGVYFRKP